MRKKSTGKKVGKKTYGKIIRGKKYGKKVREKNGTNNTGRGEVREKSMGKKGTGKKVRGKVTSLPLMSLLVMCNGPIPPTIPRKC
jgi:hypothetical protein